MQFEKEYKRLFQIILQQAPLKGDLIIWLQGDRFDRAEKVFSLYQNNFAKKILITGNNKLVGKGPRVGENNVTLKEMQEWLISRDVKSEDVMVDNSSMNTKDQAKFVISFAKENCLKRLLLVGSSYYQPRAFLTFLKEAFSQSFEGVIINQPTIVADNEIPAGRDDKAVELEKEELLKIEKYHEDVVSINEGINYLLSKIYDN